LGQSLRNQPGNRLQDQRKNVRQVSRKLMSKEDQGDEETEGQKEWHPHTRIRKKGLNGQKVRERRKDSIEETLKKHWKGDKSPRSFAQNFRNNSGEKKCEDCSPRSLIPMGPRNQSEQEKEKNSTEKKKKRETELGFPARVEKGWTNLPKNRRRGDTKAQEWSGGKGLETN